MEWKWNGKGIEKEWKKYLKIKWKLNQLEWNGIRMEVEWKIFH